jgi:transposase
MLARGAVAELLAAVLALLVRMRDLNTELVAKLAAKSRKRPPSETMRRLQLELPLVLTPAANENGPTRPKPERTKRGPKTKHLHGRPKLPAHLERIPEVHAVAPDARTCPECGHEAVTIGFKTVEKLDLRPAEFVVRQIRRETCACTNCHDDAVTAPKQDEVLDRGLLGNELLVQALVDHYDDAVPWERMARSARQQGVPLAANTLAASVGRVLDLFDPVVRPIQERALASA